MCRLSVGKVSVDYRLSVDKVSAERQRVYCTTISVDTHIGRRVDGQTADTRLTVGRYLGRVATDISTDASTDISTDITIEAPNKIHDPVCLCSVTLQVVKW